jgi:2-keto-4-pentenoate hydratase/2-oxohepta-3-ene-1,7-dioic acid hydratase in catechol pathway
LIKEHKIAGVGFGLDLTKADIQNKMKAKGLPWERAKAFDKSAVLSDFVAFDGDLTKLSMKLYINNELRQEANYDLMIYKPEAMIEEIESFMTLEDNDIIMSGTPKGVATYNIADQFLGQIYYDKKLLLEVKFVVTA